MKRAENVKIATNARRVRDAHSDPATAQAIPLPSGDMGRTPHAGAGMRRNSGPVRATSEPDISVTVLKPTVGWGKLRLGELWEFRELVFFFIWRDVKVRYKQTALGAAWAVIQPLFTMA